MTFERSQTCYYCKLEDRRVEAGGIYYCPNVLCQGPGAWSFRVKRASYKEDGSGGHTVDSNEMITAAREYVDTLPYKELPLIQHILSTIPRWEAQA